MSCGLLAWGECPWGEGSGGGDLLARCDPDQDIGIERTDYVECVVLSIGTPPTNLVIRAAYQKGQFETVWDDAVGFMENFRRGSVRFEIDSGFRFILRRTHGWVSPTVRLIVSGESGGWQLNSV